MPAAAATFADIATAGAAAEQARSTIQHSHLSLHHPSADHL
jgi:hypothetical protein